LPEYGAQPALLLSQRLIGVVLTAVLHASCFMQIDDLQISAEKGSEDALRQLEAYKEVLHPLRIQDIVAESLAECVCE
jgi:hypothetical protein